MGTIIQGEDSFCVTRVTDNLEKSSLDDRSYRVIRLPNQLEVLLVHDAETDKASASMDVNTGSFSDPEHLMGLSHFLEHMLFMGTKKYPVENAYSQYLSAHSGSSNAYTTTTSTNYYFEVAAQASEDSGSQSVELSPFYGALDRFSQFFIEPLFLSSTLDRELQAVDSENKKNLQDDQWRLNQLDKSLSNPKHPYYHFSTGNLQTLKTNPEEEGVDVRKELINYYEEKYSANLMKLVLLGKEPLDVLEEWAADLFAGVQDKNLKQDRWEDEQPFGEKDLLTQYFAKPVMDSRLLDLYFPFMDEEDLYETQPSRYISHLIGHEGPGSIMAYIKAKGWADGLSAWAYPICPGTMGLFNCQVNLTEDGLKHYKEIVKIFFQYVSLLLEAPPQEWIFEEQKGMAEVDFKFQQKTPASRFTSQISAVMQKPLPREWLLSGHSRLRKFDPAGIQQGLSFIRPDNFRMSVISQEFPGDWDQTEQWYGTEYKYEKIPADFLAEIKQAAATTASERLPELHLPHKNQFIPTKLEVEKKEVKEPSVAPTLIRNDDLVRAWFKKDDTFWVPKADVYINCTNPLPSATAENCLMASVYTNLVKDALQEYSYDAELAGLEYSVTSYGFRLVIKLSGYNDKIPVLLEKVLITMRDLVVKQDRFDIVKERTRRRMKNWEFQQPYNQVGEFTRWLSSEKSFIYAQLLAEIEPMTAEDVQAFYPQLLRSMHIETFVHGNVYKEDALCLTKLVESTLKPRALPQSTWPIRRSLIFPPGSNFLYRKALKDPKNVNNTIEYSLYIGDKADHDICAKTLLLAQMADEPAFDQLRTKEQLGYIVITGAKETTTTITYHCIIQSEKPPEYLETRFDAFLKIYELTLQNMPDSEFEDHKRSLITKVLEKLKNLSQESSRYWDHITSEYFNFELAQHDAAYVKKLTKADMIEFYQHYISPSSVTRAKLVIYMDAQGVSEGVTLEEPASKLITDSIVTGVDKIKLDHMSDKVANGVAVDVGQRQAGKPYVIENVREFKSQLAVSAGPRPVKDLSEFEELDL